MMQGAVCLQPMREMLNSSLKYIDDVNRCQHLDRDCKFKYVCSKFGMVPKGFNMPLPAYIFRYETEGREDFRYPCNIDIGIMEMQSQDGKTTLSQFHMLQSAYKSVETGQPGKCEAVLFNPQSYQNSNHEKMFGNDRYSCYLDNGGTQQVQTPCADTPETPLSSIELERREQYLNSIHMSPIESPDGRNSDIPSPSKYFKTYPLKQTDPCKAFKDSTSDLAGDATTLQSDSHLLPRTLSTTAPRIVTHDATPHNSPESSLEADNNSSSIKPAAVLGKDRKEPLPAEMLKKAQSHIDSLLRHYLYSKKKNKIRLRILGCRSKVDKRPAVRTLKVKKEDFCLEFIHKNGAQHRSFPTIRWKGVNGNTAKEGVEFIKKGDSGSPLFVVIKENRIEQLILIGTVNSATTASRIDFTRDTISPDICLYMLSQLSDILKNKTRGEQGISCSL